MARPCIAGVFLCATGLALSAADPPKPHSQKPQSKISDPSEIGTRKVATGPNFYSIEKEIALGRQLSLEVQRQAKLLEDPLVDEYINRIGQNLVRHSDVTLPVTLKIIDSDQPNAFTLPGGNVFINTGLIRLTETEAELAATLAHELAHVAARHATRQATRGQIADLGTIPLIFLGGIPGIAGRQAAHAAVPLGFMKLARGYEAEADLLAVQYLYKTGYDPNASVDVFERLEAMEKKRPGAVAQLFNSHPVTADRIDRTQKSIATLLAGRTEYIVNTSEYEGIRKRLVERQNSLKVAPSPPSLFRKPAEAAEDSENRPTLRRATN